MTKAIADLSAEDFEPHRGKSFRLAANGQALDLKLDEVQRLGTALRAGGAFSLMFLTPAGPSLPQAIYPVEHPALGTLELFVVPLGPKDGTNRYEVIFT